MDQELTKPEDLPVFNQTGHRELWLWIRDNPHLHKEDWPGWKINGGQYKAVPAHCFACESVGHHGPCNTYCPLIWEDYTCLCRKSSYAKYGVGLYESDYEAVSKAAEAIVNLPVRTELYQCI